MLPSNPTWKEGPPEEAWPEGEGTPAWEHASQSLEGSPARAPHAGTVVRRGEKALFAPQE